MKKGDTKHLKSVVKSGVDPDEQLKKLGKRIKQLRISRGYSSYEYFAYDHNISRAQFGRYEQGQDLRFSSLVKVIHALGMTLPEFFSEGFNK
jgi:transcriptional regulator with XRE-family HTH domain